MSKLVIILALVLGFSGGALADPVPITLLEGGGYYNITDTSSQFIGGNIWYQGSAHVEQAQTGGISGNLYEGSVWASTAAIADMLSSSYGAIALVWDIRVRPTSSVPNQLVHYWLKFGVANLDVPHIALGFLGSAAGSASVMVTPYYSVANTDPWTPFQVPYYLYWTGSGNLQDVMLDLGEMWANIPVKVSVLFGLRSDAMTLIGFEEFGLDEKSSDYNLGGFWFKLGADGAPSIVPVPGAILLLGSGLAGLAAFRNRRAPHSAS